MNLGLKGNFDVVNLVSVVTYLDTIFHAITSAVPRARLHRTSHERDYIALATSATTSRCGAGVRWLAGTRR